MGETEFIGGVRWGGGVQVEEELSKVCLYP